MSSLVMNKVITKLLENIEFSNKKGMIIASPSNNPPYKFHWVRDASIVMKVIIDLYKETNNIKFLILIFNYIENENHIQKLNTLTGLGEPKFNINGTSYNEPWGRPQNDGPALRIINMINIYKILYKDYPNLIKKNVLPVIFNDIQYIIDNYNKPCFDLWEEIVGWHFYTRLVQLKSIKDFIYFKNNFLEINNNSNFVIPDIGTIYQNLLNNINDHIDNDKIISSFDEKGNISRMNDASIFLAYCHINFDKEILSYFPLKYTINTSNKLLDFFNNKYKNKYNLIGRYENDKYYNGHSWIICSLALIQVYIHLYNINKEMYVNNYNLSKNIFDFILSIDVDINLSEQYDPQNNIQLSAEKLTWNYSELYFTIKKFNN